jgi:hypothetical protein
MFIFLSSKNFNSTFFHFQSGHCLCSSRSGTGTNILHFPYFQLKSEIRCSPFQSSLVLVLTLILLYFICKMV